MAENAQDIIYRDRVRPDPGFDYMSPATTAVTGYAPRSSTPTRCSPGS